MHTSQNFHPCTKCTLTWLSTARRLSCLRLGLLVFKILCALTLNPVPHSYQQNCLDVFLHNLPPAISTPENCCVSHFFSLVRSSNTRNPGSPSSSRSLSQAWETSVGSETTCEVLAAAAVELLSCSASSTTEVWDCVARTTIQTFTAKYLSGSLAAVPLTVRGVARERQRHTETQLTRSTPRWLETCYNHRVNEQESHSTTNQCSPPFPKHSHPLKCRSRSFLITASHLAQRSSPNGSLVHVLRWRP